MSPTFVAIRSANVREALEFPRVAKDSRFVRGANDDKVVKSRWNWADTTSRDYAVAPD